MKIATRSDTLSCIYDDVIGKIQQQAKDFQKKDSDWAVIQILWVEININKYQPILESSHIAFPPSIEQKRACIDVRHEDLFCFKWSVISAMQPFASQHYGYKPSLYKINDITSTTIKLESGVVSSIHFEGMIFPIELSDLHLFEELNDSIVFGLEYKNKQHQVVGPFYTTKDEKIHHINLLLLEKDENFHYVYISDVSKLIRSSITYHEHQIHICNSCLQRFYDPQQLIIPKEECKKIVAISSL